MFCKSILQPARPGRYPRLANAITTHLRSGNPEALVTVRDLACNPHPMLDEATLIALTTPQETRSPEQATRIALDEALIAEL